MHLVVVAVQGRTDGTVYIQIVLIHISEVAIANHRAEHISTLPPQVSEHLSGVSRVNAVLQCGAQLGVPKCRQMDYI